ncbi:hypothetical protein [Flammeovirga sp. SJP92]|uniref:hypothetical protein n=1 Tax=Flammeovirga sp. SJP92 TaxID=1775430 RepID=UPI000788B523|nr:hypothetical protein [Flammeovirga sp. SJP92]KXX67554.1 hypothetical protein AVL50_26185 [Flammeovirga sp. SJP92]
MTLRELIDFRNEREFQRNGRSYTIAGLSIIAMSAILAFVAIIEVITDPTLPENDFVTITGELKHFKQIEVGKNKIPNTLIYLKNYPRIEFNLDNDVSIHTINKYIESNSQSVIFKLGIPKKELYNNPPRVNAHFIIQINDDVIKSYEDYLEIQRSGQIGSFLLFLGVFAFGALFIVGKLVFPR